MFVFGKSYSQVVKYQVQVSSKASTCCRTDVQGCFIEMLRLSHSSGGESEYVDVDSEVETSVIVVDVNSVFSSVEVEDLRLDEALDTGDVDVVSEVET